METIVYTVHNLWQKMDAVHIRFAMTDRRTRPAKRDTYRHGDLRRALLVAGIALARAGGPDAVVLREATRRAGVAPNAAYRHFESRLALLQAVRMAALSGLARSMEGELAAVSAELGPAERARASLRAVGLGYLRFALTETGLFRTIFAIPYDWPAAPDPAKAGNTGLNPFQLLAVALDRMVEAGALPAERRVGAEFLAWSAVHGLALLIISGPLHDMPRARTAALGQRLVEMVETGLGQPSAPVGSGG
jgi:AcrR family transcriptional regulator